MSERPTPETDAAQFGTGKVTTDFARRLERERDEAREALSKICEKATNSYLRASDHRGVLMEISDIARTEAVK